jgi:hypothetical protein|tara:strand:- start:277 stop:531 length:255 start_codon:yes stop_codon:yes gene_type:complete
MKQFLIEFSIIAIIFIGLKIFWNDTIKYWLGQSIIGINAFACMLYMFGVFNQAIPAELAYPKIFLHGIVAIIIHTLFNLQNNKK